MCTTELVVHTANKTGSLVEPFTDTIVTDETVEMTPGKEGGGWTEVKRKHSPAQDEASPSPLNTFKGLRNVDEIDKKKATNFNSRGGSGSGSLSKSQRKKLKKNGGIQSPKLPN